MISETALDTALEKIMSVFQGEHAPMSAAEISERVGIGATVTRRLIKELAGAGLLSIQTEASESGKFPTTKYFGVQDFTDQKSQVIETKANDDIEASEQVPQKQVFTAQTAQSATEAVDPLVILRTQIELEKREAIRLAREYAALPQPPPMKNNIAEVEARVAAKIRELESSSLEPVPQRPAIFGTAKVYPKQPIKQDGEVARFILASHQHIQESQIKGEQQ
jgi:DNA-binding Lrp family transcriptional regulator